MMTDAGTPPVRTAPPWHLTGVALAGLAVLAGCNRRPAAGPTVVVSKTTDQNDELVNLIREDLRKSPDLNTCRRLTEQLNGSIQRANPDQRPAALTPAERTLLEKELGLLPPELAEITRTEFTTLDAYFLDETVLFRDIARSLDVDRLPPVARAEAALAWVARNLRVDPGGGPAVPVGFAAMRGSGTPLERTYVLLALLQQLGLDAALIGEAAKPDDVWAVGVLADGQVYLFDARLGLPLPGAEGKGVLTLDQARTAADAFKPLTIDPMLRYDIIGDRAKRAAVLVTAPLSAMSARMRFLQGMAREELAHLAVDPTALRDRFAKAVIGPDAPAVQFWSPQVLDAYPRLLFGFLPGSEGGMDNSPGEQLRIVRYQRQSVPDILPQFLKLPGEPGDRVRGMYEAMIRLFWRPGQAHDMILRGRFREATEQLVNVQTEIKRLPGTAAEMTRNAEQWATAAREFAADAIRRQRGEQVDFDRMEENRKTAESLWKDARGPLGYLQSLVSGTIIAEATYLLGQCKHEEAERLQSNTETAGNAGPAWQSAQRWWRTFISSYPNSPWVGPAKRNLARALEAGGQRDQARAQYEELANTAPTPLERLACKYHAMKLK
jgi:hypothetical protein